jgi:hypothetical protein
MMLPYLISTGVHRATYMFSFCSSFRQDCGVQDTGCEKRLLSILRIFLKYHGRGIRDHQRADNAHMGTEMLLLRACQVRGARAMARLSLEELSKLSGVSVSTIRRIEDHVYGVPGNVQADNLMKLFHTFEALGFAFSSQDARGPAVFWGYFPGSSDVQQDPVNRP